MSLLFLFLRLYLACWWLKGSPALSSSTGFWFLIWYFTLVTLNWGVVSLLLLSCYWLFSEEVVASCLAPAGKGLSWMSLSSFLVYHLSRNSLISNRLMAAFWMAVWCYCYNFLFKSLILMPPSASSWAAVDLTVLTLDFSVQTELLIVLMPLSMSSWMCLGTWISSSSPLAFWVYWFLALRGSTEWANLNLLSFFLAKMWGLIMKA